MRLRLRQYAAAADLVAPPEIASGTFLEIERTAGLERQKARVEVWRVEAVDEEVTVPAGTFTTLRVFRSNDGTGVEKRYRARRR